MLRNPIGLNVLNGFGSRCKKTIYIDCEGLPDTIGLGICFKYHNYDDVTLYFKIRAESESPYWSFASAKELGSLGSGSSAYALWDGMGQRPNPNSDLEETIKLILEAYTDSNYSNLKWTYSRLVTVRFLYPPNWNVWDIDNFDDGTKEDWNCGIASPGAYPHVSCGVTSTYALSPPNSLYLSCCFEWGGTNTWYLYKSISVPSGSEAFITINARIPPNGSDGYPTIYYVRFLYAGVVKYYFTSAIPRNRWIRVTFPVEPASSGTLRCDVRAFTNPWRTVLYIDDVKYFYK